MSLLGWLRRSHNAGNGAPWTTIALMSISLVIAAGALVWLNYVTTREWSRGTDVLLEQRQAEALFLVNSALRSDLRGAWTHLLVPFDTSIIEEDPPFTVVQLAARTFARFPYPESLLVWKRTPDGSAVTYAFNRTERQPAWDASVAAEDEPFPVTVTRDPPALHDLVGQLRERSISRQPFAAAELPINGIPYQVITHFVFESTDSHELLGFAAFTVNLQWIRTGYFGPLLEQVSRIGHFDDSLSLAILDDTGAVVVRTDATTPTTGGISGSFPLLFIDPAVVGQAGDVELGLGSWSIRVWPHRDNTQLAALRAARDTRLLITLAAIATVLALLLTIRTLRAWAFLASMKSEFISNVTHELKTPVALVRLVGDTLASGRVSSGDAVREYARLLSQESARLTKQINSLLTAARYGDTMSTRAVALKPTQVIDLVDAALECFRPTLELDFDLDVQLNGELPRVLADREAIVQVMENVVDNAIKYSTITRALKIEGHVDGRFVKITFGDRGIGIAKEDLNRVFERFYRGRNATEGGSGLGLAIARRILRAHRGKISIDSAPDSGTQVHIFLQIAKSAA